ncbi:hypothetical protein UlMin_008059 [Ulmus minor]
MGGGAGDHDDSLRCPPPPDDAVPVEDDSPVASESSSSKPPARLADAPIHLLVYFHKAFRAEVADLRGVVSDALESGSHSREFVLELLRRFEFLKIACKYHCAAEDEVIFLALDVHVRNVACTYSLEHKSIDGLFDSIFNRLNAILEEDEIVFKPFQELVFCVGTIQNFICRHMLKEEEQVFPLLMQQFSPKEQASLVWKFMCSVPVVLLEDQLPWTLSFLSPDEQVEFIHSIKDIVPKEKALQEVVTSWLGSNYQPSMPPYRKCEGGQSSYGLTEMKILLKPHSFKRFLGENWKTHLHQDVGQHPVDGLHLWHGVIRKDLIEVLEKLYQSRRSCNYSDLDAIVVKLKFLADIITFYSNALEKLFNPVINEIVHGSVSSSNEGFPIGSQIEGLHMLLYHNERNDTNFCKFVEKLCWELESFVAEISKQFAFHEAEVFSIISQNCSHELQQQLLYASVHMMPLGLLKCVITWFSAHLSQDESRSLLNGIKDGGFLINRSFASLLHEWLRNGFSGKTSVENFEKNLQQMFKSRWSFLPEQIKEAAGSSSSHSNKQPCEEPDSRLMLQMSAIKGKSSSSSSSSRGFRIARTYETSYSSVINLHIYFPEAIKRYHPFSEIPGGEDHPGSVINDPKPMDVIFYFHKALKKDLGYLVFSSAQLAENAGFLAEFRRRFLLIQFLYQIHSEAEDEVAFPALEAMGKVTNISHSYTMDHKLEVEHFGRVSLILDKMSELNVSTPKADSNVDQIMQKHNLLCARLHDMCKSMQKLLSDHIHREEVELWPLFRECFSIKEQERIIGCILGRTKAEILQDMIPWIMESLTPKEQHTMMSLWRQVTRNTMFGEWLREWWEGYDIAKVAEDSDIAPSTIADPLEITYSYFCEINEQEETLCSKNTDFPEIDCLLGTAKPIEESKVDSKSVDSEFKLFDDKILEYRGPYSDGEKKRIHEMQNVACQVKPFPIFQDSQKAKYYDFLLKMRQEDMDTAIKRVSHDSSLDCQKKSYIIQNLIVSRWIIRQHSHLNLSSDEQAFPGQYPSYRDPLELIFGCKHYKRNCKLVAPCCNLLYTCLRCHDDVADHLIDRKSVTEMMCMQCSRIQPIGAVCSTVSCNKFSMARYYCRICKIFDDDRDIYHCPYCNLCRLGKGLGIDYFHCMNCNACMARTLFEHICREKCFMDNCPICHEDIFTSSLPVKALQCGHLMHSQCFEAYTCTNYTCPLCGKSLGDMQVYFKMLDALLAGERIPDEYSGQTQVILCNDCGKRGEAPFHWLYHKCSCGSYNTRLL